MRDSIVNEIVQGLNLPEAIARKLLSDYLKVLPAELNQLKEKIKQGDIAGAAKDAHSIKGASGNLRIKDIFELTAELEQTLKFAAAGNEQHVKIVKLLLAIENFMKNLES